MKRALKDLLSVLSEASVILHNERGERDGGLFSSRHDGLGHGTQLVKALLRSSGSGL